MSTPLQDKFLSAIETSGRRNTPVEPWNHLTESYRAFDAVKHGHPLRQNSMTPRVMRYNAYIEAAGLYNRIDYPATTAPFRLVEKKSGSTVEVMLEGKNSDGSRLLIVNDGASVRMSMIDITGNAWQVPRFQDMGVDYLRWLSMTFIPHVLRIDAEHGNKIRDAVKELSKAAEESMAQPWQSADEIPDMVKDAAYYMDVFHVVLKHHMTIDFGMTGSDQPAEIDDGRFNNTSGFHGDLLTEFVPDPSNWEPAHVKAIGVGRRFAGSNMTFAEAKALYSGFMAHRNWTAVEKSLIPQFEDDEPVPAPVLRHAKRIVKSRELPTPIVQIMWRGPTGCGKSTGSKMLAAILNMPYLVFGCCPENETEDFKSQIVPDATIYDLPLDTENILTPSNFTIPNTGEKAPFFEEAMKFIHSLPSDKQDALLKSPEFFTDVAMDSDYACEQLLGRVEPSLSFENLLRLYCDLKMEFYAKPLYSRIVELESANSNDKKMEKKDFAHILSPYMKAIINGYFCEIQEGCRIKKPGVLAGLNEIDKPGNMIALTNGYMARRHPDAITVYTDNVNYVSCNPVDPSVTDRMRYIEDAEDLTKEELYYRAKKNTGVTDPAILDRCYAVWEAAKKCWEGLNTGEGSVSPRAFTDLVMMVYIDGMEEFEQCVHNCIISKASSVAEDQRAILAACSTVM